MKIHYLNLRNYRQYRDARIDFSTDSDRNFTIIEGANGDGKSNILNAITWCLYKEERHISEEYENSQLPIINEKVYHELAPGESETVEVELALGKEEIDYRIKRRAAAYRRQDGEASIRVDADPVVMYRAHDNWHKSEQPTYAINFLLPEDISTFFFFDGEQLDQFFREHSAERIKKGIVNVSQIDLLDRSIAHLNSVRTTLRKKAESISPEVDRKKDDVARAEEELAKCRKRLETLYGARDGLELSKADIGRDLRASSVEEVRSYQEKRDALEGSVKDYEAQLAEYSDRAATTLRKLGPRVYAFPALQQAAELIEARVERGDLPPRVREPFLRDLLEQAECICGCSLAKGTKARDLVLRHMEEITSTQFEEQALEGKYVLRGVLQNIPELVAQQQGVGGDIRAAEKNAIKAARKELKEIGEKIGKYGEVNLEDIGKLEKLFETYDEELKGVLGDIGAEEAEEKRLDHEAERLNREYERALGASERQAGLLIRLRLCTEALTALNQIRSELLSEIREQIERETQETFLQLIWKQGTYKSVQIHENYQLSVLNMRDMPSLGTLSAGERQVLALAFMAALGTISGFDAPVVIDTPIGRISEEPRENIAESLPNYLADTQVTLLMTDTEYTSEVQTRLNARVGKEYRLDFDESESVTEVVTL